MHHEMPEDKVKCMVCGKEMDEKHKMEGRHVHTSMIEDLKKRFIICIIITIPILFLSPLVQEVLGISKYIHFPGDSYVLFILASFVYFYGGYPFFKGIYNELKSKTPGMDTLITVAITSAYIYSSAVVFGLMEAYSFGN